jgi:hypothetical protein
MKKKLLSELMPWAGSYLANKGYGSGSNYNTSQVAGLMALFALEVINSDAPSESRNVATHEGQEKPCRFRRSCGLIEFECPGKEYCGDYEPQGG